jgi:hypothetical protein
MSGELDNLVLVYLRRIDGKIDRLTEDVQDLKHRVTSLEAPGGQHPLGHGGDDHADRRIEIRLDRIERRLDLIPSRRT